MISLRITLSGWNPIGSSNVSRYRIAASGGCKLYDILRSEGFLSPLVATLYGKLSEEYTGMEGAAVKRQCEKN